MKNKLKKGLAVLLAGTILTSSVTPALAGEPEVTVDETAYITLDYYGSRSDLSIVKSVRLNGSTEFTGLWAVRNGVQPLHHRSAAADR